MSNEWSTVLVPLLVVIGVLVLVAFIGRRVRRGGGSMTTIAMGATDEFLSKDQSKAVETVVDQNAGKRQEDQGNNEPRRR